MKPKMLARIVAVTVVAVAVVVVLRAEAGSVPPPEPVVPVADVGPGVVPDAEPVVRPQLLDLGADTCIPCKKMAPILVALREDFDGQFDVVFIDVWKNREVMKSYGLRMIPTQIFFDEEGTELFRHEGFYSREDILGKWTELGYAFTAPADGEAAG